MISKYRSVLMGIATFGILGIHSIDYGIQYPGWIHKLAHMGLFGVDIFLLLSGMGLCKSMNRGGAEHILQKTNFKSFIPVFADCDSNAGNYCLCFG